MNTINQIKNETKISVVAEELVRKQIENKIDFFCIKGIDFNFENSLLIQFDRELKIMGATTKVDKNLYVSLNKNIHKVDFEKNISDLKHKVKITNILSFLANTVIFLGLLIVFMGNFSNSNLITITLCATLFLYLFLGYFSVKDDAIVNFHELKIKLRDYL